MEVRRSNARRHKFSGSVAERIMIFENRPEKVVKTREKQIVAKQVLKEIKTVEAHKPSILTKREMNSNVRQNYIPRFYFKHGNMVPTIATEKTVRCILAVFDSYPNNQISIKEVQRLFKVCELPFYWRQPILKFIDQNNTGMLERQKFLDFWKQITVYCHDEASKFVYVISRGQRSRPYIIPDELESIIQDVVETHPGLSFLREATEFHSKYVQTVIARIFYSVNRSWSGKITAIELRNSNLLEVLQLLEVEDDINQIMAFFSYEHFYVIYCKFWELDTDHDFYLNKGDLERYADNALSSRIIDRIFSECVSHYSHAKDVCLHIVMTYPDFVWFLISEEDKKSPMAIEYWFRCLDIDGDGYLSMYELEYFYEEQQQRMESMGIEILPFEDCLCQMFDIVKPKYSEYITLGDLKKCKLADQFFDTFFNFEKFLLREQRDPSIADNDTGISSWDRYAAEEYEILISEDHQS